MKRAREEGTQAADNGATFNVNNALDKEHENVPLAKVVDLPVSALQGLGERCDELFGAFHVYTIGDLAEWRHFRIARAICTLAAVEEKGKRAANNMMNVMKAVDKSHQQLSFTELAEAPPSALKGLADWTDSVLKKMNITTIRKLGELKYALWAEAFATLARTEDATVAGRTLSEADKKAVSDAHTLDGDTIAAFRAEWLSFCSPTRDTRSGVAGAMGSMVADDVLPSMTYPGFERFWKQRAKDLVAARMVFDLIDVDHDERVQFDEWVAWVKRVKEDNSNKSHAQLIVDLYDKDKNGSVSKEEVRKWWTANNKLVPTARRKTKAQLDADIDAVFNVVDSDKDGQLSAKEIEAALDKNPEIMSML